MNLYWVQCSARVVEKVPGVGIPAGYTYLLDFNYLPFKPQIPTLLPGYLSSYSQSTVEPQKTQYHPLICRIFNHARDVHI